MAPQKGKQGTRGMKQIHLENKESLKFYSYVSGACFLAHVIVNFSVYWDSMTMGVVTMMILTAVIQIGCIQFMRYMARAVFSENEQLIDCGVDLNMEAGVAEHVKDVILLTSSCQIMALVSSYFWLFMLLIPGRGLHLAWVNILGPYFFQPPPNEEMEEKKRKKMERKMARKFR